MKNWFWIKLFLSVALISGLVWLVDRPALIQALSSVSFSFLIYITLAYIAGQVLSAYKWLIIVNSSDSSVNLAQATKAYFLGMFANCYGLGVVGGDVARGLLIAQKGSSKTHAIATVIADRAHGLAVLAGIGVCAAILWGHEHITPFLFWLITAFGLGICLAWLLGPKLLLLFVGPENPWRQKAEKVAKAFPKDKGIIVYITFLSALLHVWQILMHWFIANELGVSVPFVSLLVAIPFVNILSSLPISWNGLGVREAGYIFFLTPTPLTQELVVAMGAIWLLATTISSVLGGVMALFTKEFKNINTKRVALDELPLTKH